MIKLQKEGKYRLLETRSDTKILYLGRTPYAWVHIEDLGDILVASYKQHRPYELLSSGRYRIYNVKDEPALTDQTHLELEAGKGEWQSYLLLTGLPDKKRRRTRIIPSMDNITGSRGFAFPNSSEHSGASRNDTTVKKKVRRAGMSTLQTKT